MSTHTSRAGQKPSQRPRLTVTGPLLRGSGELHIVGRVEVVTILDPEGAVHRLLLLADGSRTTDEIVGALASELPQVPEQDVRDAVAELEATGVLEDVALYGRVRPTPAARRGAHAGLLGVMTPFMPVDDDSLLDELRWLFRAADPVPAAVRDAAVTTFAWRSAPRDPSDPRCGPPDAPV